ncbi:MAG: glycoside hydrolase family 32 protein [Verrucomicrobiales bacterium]|nr:glycoside hydrolase family 32 protein [Verrucomicrobiales bacterium]
MLPPPDRAKTSAMAQACLPHRATPLPSAALAATLLLFLSLASARSQPVSTAEPATLSDGRDAIRRAMESVSNAVARAASDPARPVLHFRPPAQWMNDPNGLLQHRGWFHLFYQHNPYGDTWGHMHWGHARTRDLLHWEHLPIALWPSTERGEEHVFSGSAALNGNGDPTLLYTSIARDRDAASHAEQWAAFGSDDLLTWRKHPGNPALAESLHGERKVYDWRDPYVVHADGRTFLVCGGNLNQAKGGEAVVNLYESVSADFTRWKYRGILFTHPDPSVRNLECPLLFPLGGTWILIVSPHRRVEWFSGVFDVGAGRFLPRRHGLLDYSDQFYAPNAAPDATDRQILFGWVRGFPEGRGWNGCLSLPRVLSVAGGVLQQRALPELEQLRTDRKRLRNQEFDREFVVPDLRGETLDIEATFERGEAASVGLRVLRAPDGSRGVDLRWDGRALEVAGASMSLFGDLTGGRVEFRVIVDRSCLEVHAAGQVLTRVVPFHAGETGVSAIADGRGARITAFTAWKLKPVW